MHSTLSSNHSVSKMINYNNSLNISVNNIPNPTMYYAFDTSANGSSQIFNKITGLYDATLVGTVSVSSTCIIGVGSLYFSNSNPGATTQYVTLPSTTFTSTTVSFSCWFFIPSFSGSDYMTIFEFGNAAGGDHIRLFYRNNPQNLIATINSIDKTIVGLSSYVNSWVHAVWIINGANWNIYLNGSSVHSSSNNTLFSTGTKTSCAIGRAPTWGNLCMYGYIDEFRVYNGTVLTTAQVGALYSLVQNNLVMYYNFNTSANASSKIVNTFTGLYDATLIGSNISISTSTFKIGTGSLYLSGSADSYVSIAPFVLSTTSVSYSCWILYPSFYGSNYSVFYEMKSSNDNMMFFMNNSTKQLIATINAQDQNICDLTPYINVWTHFVWVINGVNWQIYINGVSVYNTSNNNLCSIGTKNNNVIGTSSSYGQNYYINTYIDDFRVYDTAISSAQVAALYNFVFSSSTGIPTNGLTFSLDFSSPTIPVTDNFGSTLTQNSTIATQPVTLAYDSTRSYVLYTGPYFTQNSISTNYATPSTFTRTFWVYFMGTGNYSDCLIGSANCYFVNYPTRSPAVFTVELNKLTGAVNISTTAIPANVWRHVAVTYDGTTCIIYMNGSSVNSGTGTYTGETGTLNAGGLCIGDYNNGGYTSNGFYDQIHCYNRALTASEVLQIYNIELALTPSINIPPYLRFINMLYVFSVRLLVSTYTGPVLTLRRSSDNATSDFYTDATQSYLTTGANNTGTTFATWVGGGTAYVTKWYDQSGKRNNATQATTANQPTISLQTNNSVSKYVIYFSNATTNTYVSLTTPQKPNTMFCHFTNTNTLLGTIFTAAVGTDYGQRFNYSGGGTLGLIDSGGFNYDWYKTCTGTRYSYVNGTSATVISFTEWNSMALSATGAATFTTLRDIGTDGYAYTRGMNGYMTEMIGHNTGMSTDDLTAFYTNRLF